jgi:hypothetical protein
MDKAKIGEFSGDSIVTFPDIPLVVPRLKNLNNKRYEINE